MLEELENYIALRIPNGKLINTPIPGTNISLRLLNEDYPQQALSYEQATALMDNPPYWCFCWASGQVMAQTFFDNPADIKNKNILDFGCGSGVVGIAAKMNGANQVVCCDIDEMALAITHINAQENQCDVELSPSLQQFFDNFNSQQWVICVADVFYDTDNLPLLELFCEQFADVWVSDSRTKPDQLQQLTFHSKHTSNTIPDLDESAQFRYVNTYRKKIKFTASIC